MKKIDKKNNYSKALAHPLELFALALVFYLLIAPIFPLFKYRLELRVREEIIINRTEILQPTTSTNDFTSVPVDQQKEDNNINRLVIEKIGVNVPIVEAATESGLEKGAWRVPKSSTPDIGGNTVITAHRFKYLPPNNKTFYLLDKLEAGDILTVRWQQQDYYYQVSEKKVVAKYDLSILAPSANPRLTLFTCHPLFSSEQRLVIKGVLVDE